MTINTCHMKVSKSKWVIFDEEWFNSKKYYYKRICSDCIFDTVLDRYFQGEYQWYKQNDLIIVFIETDAELANLSLWHS